MSTEPGSTSPFTSGSPGRRLTRSVVAMHPGTATPFERHVSRTKTSSSSFVSPGAKFVQLLMNATKRPSSETAGTPDVPSAVSGPGGSVQYAPAGDTLTIVLPATHPPPTGTPFETHRSRRWTANVPASLTLNTL